MILVTKLVGFMKRVFYFFAVAALACITACQREVLPETEVPENETSFTFVSKKPVLEDENPTRTEWTGETIQWSKDDQIRMAYTVAGVWQGASDENTSPKLYASDKLTEATEVAEFTVNDNFKSTATGAHIFYGLYPGTLSASDFSSAPIAAITIPTEQTPAADSFDGAADVMIGVSEELAAKPSTGETVLMNWTRLVAHADLTIKNLTINEGEIIDNVTLTAQEDADLVGMHSLNLVTGEISNPQGATNEIVVKANNLTYADKTIKVWASMLPATLTELTVTVETDKAYYVRSFTGISREFKKNMRNTMNIGMSSAVRKEKAQNIADYEESFSNSLGEFTTKNTVLPEGLTYVWTHDSKYHNAKGSAYKSGANAATSYLISPELLIGTDKSKLSFYHAVGYLSGAAFSDYFSVVVIEGENETPLVLDVTPSTTGNFTEWKTSTASLSSYVGQKIKIAFKYTSTSTVAGTWEIKDFKVTDVKTKLAAGLSFGENTSFEIELGDDFTAPTLINPNNLAVTYASSDPEIAEVNETTGAVTMGEKAGTVTITATFEGNDDYNEGSASYTIKVIDPNVTAPDPETIVFADITPALENGVQYTDPFDGGNFTVTFGGSGNDGKYYTTGSGIRTYGGGTVTVASTEYDIVRIDYTFSAANYAPAAGSYSVNTGTITPGTNTVWTGTAKSIELKNTASSGNWRLQSVKVTYAGSGSVVPTTYAINLEEVVNGTIAVQGGLTEAEAGATITLIATPDEGYVFETWEVLDGNGDEVSVSNNTFTMPESEVYIAATFVQEEEPEGDDAVFDYPTLYSSVTSGSISLDGESDTVDGVTIAYAKVSGNNAPQYYSNGTNLRIYNESTMTVTVPSGKLITSIDFSQGTTTWASGKMTADSGNVNDSAKKWTSSSDVSSVVLTVTGSFRFTQIVVTYK